MIALREEWSDDCQALLESLGMFGAAIVPLAGLDDRLGIPGDELELILTEARELDLVVDWEDAPVGASVMLTSRAADHLGLELVAPSRFNIGTKTGCRTVRWVLRGDARNERADESDESPESVVFGVDGSLDEQADRSALTAEALAIRTEEALRQGLAQRDAELSRWKPLLILGVRQAWPVANDPNGHCGVCRGGRLERATFCLWCGRSGVDGMLERVPRVTVRHAYRPGRLPGGKGGEPVPKVVKVPTTKRRKTGKRKAAAKGG